MKYIVFRLMLILTVLSCNSENAQKKQPADQNELQNDSPLVFKSPDTAINREDSRKDMHPENYVLNIRNEVQRINTLATDSTKHTFICDTEGTIIYYTYSGKVVKVIINWGYLGDGSTKSEYYFKDDKLIFEYELMIGGPAGLPETRMEQRIYVRDDKTVKFMRNQKVMSCRKCEFRSTSREYKVLRANETGDYEAALCN